MTAVMEENVVIERTDRFVELVIPHIIDSTAGSAHDQSADTKERDVRERDYWARVERI